MKTKFLHLLIIIFSVSLGSCTLEKRVHRKGYHVELIKAHKEKLVNTKSLAKKKCKYEPIKEPKRLIKIDDNQQKTTKNNVIKTDDITPKLNLYPSSKIKTVNISKNKISTNSKDHNNHSNYKFIDGNSDEEKNKPVEQKRRLTILEKLVISLLPITLVISLLPIFLWQD